MLVARGTREWAHTRENTPDGPAIESAEGLPALAGNTEEWAGDAAKGYGLLGGSWRDPGHEVGPLVAKPPPADLGAAGLRVARTLPLAR